MIDRIGSRVPLPPQRVDDSRLALRTSLGPTGVPIRQIAEGAALSSLSHAARDLAKSPPIDTVKVATLRTALAAGAYTINPDAIADKMIHDLPPAHQPVAE